MFAGECDLFTLPLSSVDSYLLCCHFSLVDLFHAMLLQHNLKSYCLSGSFTLSHFKGGLDAIEKKSIADLFWQLLGLISKHCHLVPDMFQCETRVNSVLLTFTFSSPCCAFHGGEYHSLFQLRFTMGLFRGQLLILFPGFQILLFEINWCKISFYGLSVVAETGLLKG